MWKKRQSFPWKNFEAYFLHSIQHDNCYETIYKSSEGQFRFIVQVMTLFLYDLRGCWKHKFLKKGNLPNEEKILGKFSRIVECAKPRRTVCKGLKGILTNTEEFVKSFVQHLRACGKHKFLKKKATFPVIKVLSPFFLVLTAITNFKRQFWRVQKVFYLLLWKLEDKFCNTKILLKTHIFEKKAITTVKKFCGLIFLVLSGVTKSMGHFWNVQKNF